MGKHKIGGKKMGLVYTKRYISLAEIEKQYNSLLNEGQESLEGIFTPSYKEFIKQMRDYTVYVPVPERLEGKDGFTDLAINLSERYQYDVDIFDHGNEIEVIFYFELFAYLSELKELLILADKIVVECDSTKENSLKVILEYYTHEQYFNGKAKRNII